jgi:hypothetical protein
MSWYTTGTVSVTNNSATVTGSGTAWVANVLVGEAFIGPDGRTYEITDVVSNTSMTIAPNYLGTNQSGQAYTIVPVRGIDRQNQSLLTELITNYQSVVLGIGAGLFPWGSAAAPAFRFVGDEDTGIYRLGANAVGVATGGTARMVVDSSGNVGIGTDNPSLFGGRLVVAGNLTFDQHRTITLNGAGPALMTNPADAGSLSFNVGTTAGFQSGVQIYGGSSGVANTVNFYTASVERMRIASGGNVGIGTTSPAQRLDVSGAENAVQARFGSITSRGLLIGMEVSEGVTDAGSYFNALGAGSGTLIFKTEGSERLRITAAGIVRPGADNTQSLGTGSFRFTTLFAATGTINTSDEREKHWRGELNAAELRAAKRIIGELGIYQWNDAVAEKGEDGARLHFGVRAQQAFAIMEDEGLDWGRYAWACYDQWGEQTEPVMVEVAVPKTRKVTRPSTLIDPATGQPAMVEVDEPYEETEMQATGETRVTLEAGDRYGVRPDQLAFWLIAAQAAFQADLEARIAALETA